MAWKKRSTWVKAAVYESGLPVTTTLKRVLAQKPNLRATQSEWTFVNLMSPPRPAKEWETTIPRIPSQCSSASELPLRPEDQGCPVGPPPLDLPVTWSLGYDVRGLLIKMLQTEMNYVQRQKILSKLIRLQPCCLETPRILIEATSGERRVDSVTVEA